MPSPEKTPVSVKEVTAPKGTEYCGDSSENSFRNIIHFMFQFVILWWSLFVVCPAFVSQIFCLSNVLYCCISYFVVKVLLFVHCDFIL